MNSGIQKCLRTAEAADYLGSAKSTLEKLRVHGGGPVFSKLGKRGPVVYRIADLDEWLASKRRSNTSEA